MPTWLLIVLIVVVVLVLLVLVGGIVGARRRTQARAGSLLRDVAAANEQLALARADDRGWDRDTIDAAARSAHLERRPDAKISAIHLIQVVDRPGTDDDEARLHVVDETGEHELLLKRQGDAWTAAPSTSA